MKLITFVLTLFFLSACGQEASNSRTFNGMGAGQQANSAPDIAQIPCGCTAQHDPVCTQTNVQLTNACIANCYGLNYSMGPCEGGSESFCNQRSGYVCAQPPMPECPEGLSCATVMPAPKTYADECTMMQAGASLIHMGVCE